jgi:hypothetical protein
MNRSHPAWPLRCDPNGHRSDHGGAIPRWGHAILRAVLVVCPRQLVLARINVLARNEVVPRNDVFPRTGPIMKPTYLTSARLAKCQAVSPPLDRQAGEPHPMIAGSDRTGDGIGLVNLDKNDGEER